VEVSEKPKRSSSFCAKSAHQNLSKSESSFHNGWKPFFPENVVTARISDTVFIVEMHLHRLKSAGISVNFP